MVFRTLTRLMGSSEGVDDLAQEAFLRLFRALSGFRGDAELSTYLYRIVVNLALDARRRRGAKRHREIAISADNAGWEDRLPSPDRNAEQQLGDRQFSELVEQALEQLRPAQRAVLVLYHQEELSYEQIASALSMPVNTVRTHLHRGRAHLRTLLAPYSVERTTP